MHLIHKLKTKKQHTIPIDAARALTPAAFASYTDQNSEGERTPLYAGWRMQSTQEGKEKYAGHSFELVIEPHEIDAAIEALQTIRKRFAG